jgi:RNA polymerase sigma-70 factor (ECF subfamily)
MAEGDEMALVEFYELLAGTLHACCLRILRDPEEARDATAEAFWRLWSRADRFDPERCSAMAWVLTVTRRLALDRRRSLVRRGRMLERLHVLSVASARSRDPGPTGERLAISRALAGLSEGDRRLLDSAYFEGLSGSEIAARDGLPLGTVKSRMRSALARLRSAFHGDTP